MTQYIKEFVARVDAETVSVKSQLKSAIENQDAESYMQSKSYTSLKESKRTQNLQMLRKFDTKKPEEKSNVDQHS